MFGFFLSFLYYLSLVLVFGLSWDLALSGPAKFLFFWNLFFSFLFICFIFALFMGILTILIRLPFLGTIVSPFSELVGRFGFRILFSRASLFWVLSLAGILSGSYILAYTENINPPISNQTGLFILLGGVFFRRLHRKNLKMNSKFFVRKETQTDSDRNEREVASDQSPILKDSPKMYWFKQEIHPPHKEEISIDAIAVRNIDWTEGLILGWRLTPVNFPSVGPDIIMSCPGVVVTGNKNDSTRTLHSLVSFAFYDKEGRLLCGHTQEGETGPGDCIALSCLWARYPFDVGLISSLQVNLIFGYERAGRLKQIQSLGGDENDKVPLETFSELKISFLDGVIWTYLRKSTTVSVDSTSISGLEKYRFGKICPVALELKFSTFANNTIIRWSMYLEKNPNAPVYYLAFYALYDRDGKLRHSGNMDGVIEKDGSFAMEPWFDIPANLLQGEISYYEVSYYESEKPVL
ncbi:hypothetical protein [Leptospira ilyithenensis]|uniref:Uncharacterized protein n=1 Tax=Leptospira ilyithenensis TaxID=2484901 RepID=A0A4R9LSM3_9LEPT|nr:hypothetical protein [Leptospira ilyithenensis]TGN14405.1 hypothetical protein EHS11_01850 [Leptospira ilyithenensis]